MILAFARDLKMPTSNLSALAKELGCKIRKQDVELASGGKSSGGSVKVDFADLVMPLTFPQRRKPIKKKM